MNEQAVISCPRCARQYEIDAMTDRIVAQCGVCKAHFVLIIPRLAAPAEDALVLEKEIEPGIAFFREGCETLARNVCELLRMVDCPTTPERVMEMVQSLPNRSEDIHSQRWNDGLLCRTLRTAHMDHLGGADRLDRLSEYFLVYIPDRFYYAQDMLQAAFAGVLGGIDWPTPVEATVVVDRPDASGAPTTPLPPRLRRFSWLRGNS